MYEITEIYKTQYLNGKFGYAGTLRNEKIFNIDDRVFFVPRGLDNEIHSGRIIGVEKTLDENPEYIYKILFTSQHTGMTETSKLICDRIFESTLEAKESALKNLELMANLQLDEIERYFSQFETKQIK